MADAIEMMFKMAVAGWLYYRALRFAFLVGAKGYPLVLRQGKEVRGE